MDKTRQTPKETPINLALSVKYCNAPHVQPSRCFHNSTKALLQIRELTKAYYCEGYACIRGPSDPIEHGWLELDNEVIDLTLAHNIVERDIPMPKKLYYLPAKKWNREQLRRALKRVKAPPLLDWQTLGGNPSFRNELVDIMTAFALSRADWGRANELKDYAKQFLPIHSRRKPDKKSKKQIS